MAAVAGGLRLGAHLASCLKKIVFRFNRRRSRGRFGIAHATKGGFRTERPDQSPADAHDTLDAAVAFAYRRLPMPDDEALRELLKFNAAR